MRLLLRTSAPIQQVAILRIQSIISPRSTPPKKPKSSLLAAAAAAAAGRLWPTWHVAGLLVACLASRQGPGASGVKACAVHCQARIAAPACRELTCDCCVSRAGWNSWSRLAVEFHTANLPCYHDHSTSSDSSHSGMHPSSSAALRQQLTSSSPGSGSLKL